MDRMVTKDVLQRAMAIRLVLTDCDGVLTDAGVYYSSRGEEMKRFHIRDGMGVRLLVERAGITTGILTGELSESVRRRAEKLQISELHLDVSEKGKKVEEITSRLDLSFERVAFIGDDINDLSALKKVGLSACPADAVREVRETVDFVCQAKGGQGAFREFADFILAAQVSA
jgi:3-deoxy-D-manno-octulosonate 8-phosphate phosphatase (KDO 8-P phosphatase)